MVELGFASGVLCNFKQPRTTMTKFHEEETVFREVITKWSFVVVDGINVGWKFDG